jgi:hypothetical protein
LKLKLSQAESQKFRPDDILLEWDYPDGWNVTFSVLLKDETGVIRTEVDKQPGIRKAVLKYRKSGKFIVGVKVFGYGQETTTIWTEEFLWAVPLPLPFNLRLSQSSVIPNPNGGNKITEQE